MGSNHREQSGWSRTVAAQIRAERAASGLTQAELMARAGIPRSTYLRIEKGTHVADTTELKRITGALDISVSEFFRRVEVRMCSLRYLPKERDGDGRESAAKPRAGGSPAGGKVVIPKKPQRQGASPKPQRAPRQ